MHSNLLPRSISKMQRNLIVLSMIGLFLSACTVGPNYMRPSEKNLNNFHNATAITADNDTQVTPIDVWWKGFNDPELNEIVQRALKQNLDLKASLARVKQARAMAMASKAKLFPTVNASTDAIPVRQSLENPIAAIGRNLPGFKRNATFYDVYASASWEIDLFGGLSRGKELAKAEAEAAEASHLGVRISVAAEVADAYFQIGSYQARLAIARSQVKTDKHLLNLVKLRKTYGAASDLQVTQAEALMRNARATIPPLLIGLESQFNRLDVLMGAQAGTYAVKLVKPALIPTIPAISVTQSAGDLFHRRPDIVAAERKLAASNARIGTAISDYYPKISLSGLLGFQSMNLSNLFNSETFQPAAVGGLRWRLFDFGMVDAEVDQAKGANAEAFALYRQSVLRATEDVEDAFMLLAQNKVQADEVAKEEVALVRAYYLVQENYKAGAVSLTDVLDANRELLAARDKLAQARFDTARAAVASFRALGGGW